MFISVKDRNRGGAPKISVFGMCLSGAFLDGAQKVINHLVTEKFPPPTTFDNLSVSLSYLVARQRWADWWMRFFQRIILNCVAKSIISGIRICKANAPTALHMDHAAEILETGPTWN